jgi:hypothetical protein
LWGDLISGDILAAHWLAKLDHKHVLFGLWRQEKVVTLYLLHCKSLLVLVVTLVNPGLHWVIAKVDV